MAPSHFLERVNALEPNDTWAGFEASAEVHYFEAIHLMTDGWRSGAIYLLGYVTELLLKAATFRALGIPPAQPLRRRARFPTATSVIILDHDLVRLRDQLKIVRKDSGNPIAPDVWGLLAPRIDGMAKNWSEILRYRSTPATHEEARAVLNRVDWIITNYKLL